MRVVAKTPFLCNYLTSFCPRVWYECTLARRSHFTAKKSRDTTPLNVTEIFRFQEWILIGDALLGLIEKGQSELAAQLISNVGHWLKIIRKINQLLRERLKHVSRYGSRADRGKTGTS